MFRASNRRAESGARLIVDQLAIQDGRWQSHPAHMRAIDAASMRAHASRGDLYLLIETSVGATLAGDLCEQLITTIIQTYYGLRGSTTRGLREALLGANNVLFERNLRADSEHRSVVGISCVVMRDGDVYIAQLGPALVCVANGGVLTRYPSESIWLQSENPSSFDMKREPPVGLRREVEPDLYHATFGRGDLLLLASTSLVRLAADRELTTLTRDMEPQAVRQTLEQLGTGGDLSAMIVAWPDEASAASAAQITPQTGAVAVEAQNAPPDSASPVTEDNTYVSPPWEEEPYTSGVSGYDDAADGPPYPEEEDHPLASARPAMTEQASQSAGPPRPREPLIDLEGLRDTLSDGADRLRQGTEQVLQRVLPDELPERPVVRRQSRESMSLSGRALVAIALAIPLLMVFIVLMTRAQYERVREGQFKRLQSLAQARYDSAMRTQDRTLMRQELYDALAKVREGQMIQPGDETLDALERNILHKLDEVDVVTRIYHYWRLYEFEETAVAAQSLSDSSRIVIRGVDVFLLNRGSDRVFKFLLNDVGDALQSASTNPVLVQRGEMRGGVRLGDMVDIAWMEAGGQRTLSTFVILERAGSLLAYDPQQGIDVLPVADSDRWLKPEAIGSYYGNLYVLDPLLGHILKYEPSDNAYTQPPSYYVNPGLQMDLTGAVDMAIDGNVYVLFADGRIEKFFNGEPRSFTLAGLPSPMTSPTTIFVSGEKEPEADGHIYVTDTGNERIVEFDKEGNFLRQFRDNPGDTHLAGLRGLYVDDERGRMFILSGTALWLVNLPTP